MSTIEIVSPVDGSIYARRSTASADAIERAATAARASALEWRSTPIAERALRCSAIVDEMLAMEQEIVPELAWQMGRPVRYAPGELKGFAERARHMIAIAQDALEPIDPGPKPGFKREIRREPLGVVFTIAPWNYPYLTTVNSVIPALMAGNAVLLKHASHTLLVGERFQRACDRARLPNGLFQHLILDHEQTASIIASGAVDMVCFTGSVVAGRTMERSAAGLFISMGLELGGKDPAYVRTDANLEHAIENIADGAFFNSGQSCCGIERVYVDEALFDDFVAGVVEVARNYVLGNPLDPNTTLGPLVKTSAAEFVRGQVNDAVASGAQIHVDSSHFDRNDVDSAYMAPQVLTNVHHGMRIMTEESFGPVVGIMKVSGDDEAVHRMNDSDLGLSAAIWTEDEAAARRIGERLETGTVFMNRCDYLDPALAWTGVKNTGRGCTLSALGYDALTRPKSFHLRTSTR